LNVKLEILRFESVSHWEQLLRMTLIWQGKDSLYLLDWNGSTCFQFWES